MMCMFKRKCECGNDDPSMIRVPPGIRFCRGNQSSLYFVRCKICGKRTPDFTSEEDAAKAWNLHNLEREVQE